MIEIAKSRIDILFSKAKQEYKENPQRSNRYVELALKVSTKYNTKIHSKWKRNYCKNCHKFLQIGSNSKIRLSNKNINIKCLECNHKMHISYKKEQKLKRRAKIDFYTIKKRNYE